MRDFKILVPAGSAVEVQPEILQRLPRHVIEGSAIQTRDRMRQQTAGGFQMALQANLDLPVRTQPRRIDDRRPDLFGCGAGRARDGNVPRSGSMASLAIDALRKQAAIARLGPGLALRRGNARVGVMAEHALVVNRAGGALVIQPVVAGIHPQ